MSKTVPEYPPKTGLKTTKIGVPGGVLEPLRKRCHFGRILEGVLGPVLDTKMVHFFIKKLLKKHTRFRSSQEAHFYDFLLLLDTHFGPFSSQNVEPFLTCNILDF